MYGKLTCVLILAIAMLIHDIPTYKTATKRERIIYAWMLVPIIYLTFLFVTSVPWPNLDTLMNLFQGPAGRFVHWLNPNA